MNTRHPLYRLARSLALCAVIGLAAAPAARAERRDRFVVPRETDTHWTVDGQVVDVQVQVDGQTAPLYLRPGTFDRHYFQAFEGRNYSLVLRNTTGRRIGVLIAVDGLNVVNGERSELSRHEPMYVLDPYESAVISGWRSSLDEVRRFVFVDERRSYAERTGQANGDMGWIRVLAFRETPLSLVHIENFRRATLAGAIVFPLTPSFYNRPDGIDAIVEQFAGRILDLLRLPHALGKRWGSESQ